MEVSWAGVTLTEVAAPTETRWIAEKVDSPVQVCGRRRVLFSPFFLRNPKTFHHRGGERATSFTHNLSRTIYLSVLVGRKNDCKIKWA
jgi:hypothetical protein